MKTVRLRNVILGEGRPAVAVPVPGRSEEEILCSARAARDSGAADMIEWRADYWPEVLEAGAMERVMGELREVLGEMPVLFTFRTAAEGGAAEITPEEYICLCGRAGALADAVDVEMLGDEETAARALAAVHAAGTPVVGSWHCFSGTPEKEDMVRRLRRMQEMGADIPKLAVMPRSRSDVLALLGATLIMYEQYADRPIITMSMGSLGVVSRISGELFGSALSFGAVGVGSAPGQVDAAELRSVLELLRLE